MKGVSIFKAYFNSLGEMCFLYSYMHGVVIICVHAFFIFQDYRVSHIDLFTEREGLGVMSSYFDDNEEMQGFGVMQKTCSMKVHWGT